MWNIFKRIKPHFFFFQVEREKLRSEVVASKSVLERSNLDRSLFKLEEDNAELKRQIEQLQAQLAEAEQQHAQR